MSHKLKNTYILVRHAESQANAKNVVASSLDLDKNHLTEKGRKQAMSLSKNLKSEFPVIHDIIVSPFIRTRETSSILSSLYPNANVSIDFRLIERQMTAFEDKNVDSMHQMMQVNDTLWTEEFMNMESYQRVFQRTHETWSGYEGSHQSKICIIVSHAINLKLILGWFDGYRGGYLSPYFPHMNQYYLNNAEFRCIQKKEQNKSCHITRINVDK